ncbi:putative PurR-regulated permease PerM [Kitasatospora sp. GAS204A]
MLGPGRHPDALPVVPGLALAAGYAWRLLVISLCGYVALVILERLQLIAIALFLALVVTSVLRPAAELVARVLPRGVAVSITVLGALLLLVGLLSLVGEAVMGESATLKSQFHDGLIHVEHWLEGTPLHLRSAKLTNLQGRIGSFLSTHRSALISTALNGAGHLVVVVAVAALALFCSIFFIHSGDSMWHWLRRQLPRSARSRWDRAGHAAWRTFAGYTRGIVIVAASNAVLVGIALVVLRVPLALPLTLLEFFATLVPLVGSPIAMGIASVVALAARGPLTALVILVLIVVIGQVEGHILHPFVMGWAVRVHPVAVALSVTAGEIVAGVIGAVVAVPMVAVAWSVICDLRASGTKQPAASGTDAVS